MIYFDVSTMKQHAGMVVIQSLPRCSHRAAHISTQMTRNKLINNREQHGQTQLEHFSILQTHYSHEQMLNVNLLSTGFPKE